MKQLRTLPLCQHLPPKFSSHLGKRRSAWAQDLNPFPIPFFQQRLSNPPHLFCHGLRPSFTVSDQSEIDEPGEGRIFQGFSELNLLLIEPDDSHDPLPSEYYNGLG